MSFRLRVLVAMLIVVVAAVAGVTLAVQAYTRRAFDRMQQQNSQNVEAEFRREFQKTGSEVVRRVELIANSDEVASMASQISQSNDIGPYVGEATTYAKAQQLDILEFLTSDGTIISSAHWPARFGYKEVSFPQSANTESYFLRNERSLQDEVLAIEAVRTVTAHGKTLSVLGGLRLDAAFLSSLTLPAGTRLVLEQKADRQPPRFLGTVHGDAEPARLMAVADKQKRDREKDQEGAHSAVLDWAGDDDSETITAIPLTGIDGTDLGTLFIADSRRESMRLVRDLGRVGLGVALGSVLPALMLSYLVGKRLSRPLEDLAIAADEISLGHWDARVSVEGSGETARLATSFNHMASELTAQRGRLIQTERVAAWRELARRLAHELKNPLFPLQITVENLLRSRHAPPEVFEETFQESASTLLAEISNLKTIIDRFRDFSKMPAPEMQSVDVNALVREVAQLYKAQLSARSLGTVRVDLRLADGLPSIQADPVLLRQVLENLILNAMDAISVEGVITVATRQQDRSVRIDVSDTGAGLTPEECERLFTPYYTTKREGTGLGLAIVQSVISDHQGTITVSSGREQGTTFHIELPINSTAGQSREAEAHAG